MLGCGQKSRRNKIDAVGEAGGCVDDGLVLVRSTGERSRPSVSGARYVGRSPSSLRVNMPRPTNFGKQDMKLFGASDDTAGDARRRATGRSTSDGVNDDGGAAIAKDGMIVAAHGHIGGDDGGASSAISADD